jgi:hypothetical protein
MRKVQGSLFNGSILKTASGIRLAVFDYLRQDLEDLVSFVETEHGTVNIQQ